MDEDFGLEKDRSRKDRISHKNKRNPMAEEVLDRKGPYKIKIENPKKSTYKRERIRVNDVKDFYDDEE